MKSKPTRLGKVSNKRRKEREKFRPFSNVLTKVKRKKRTDTLNLKFTVVFIVTSFHFNSGLQTLFTFFINDTMIVV